MPENQTKSHSGDQRRTYAGQGYAVPYLARKFGLTKQEARDLIRKVGHDRAKLNEAAQQLKTQR